MKIFNPFHPARSFLSDLLESLKLQLFGVTCYYPHISDPRVLDSDHFCDYFPEMILPEIQEIAQNFPGIRITIRPCAFSKPHQIFSEWCQEYDTRFKQSSTKAREIVKSLDQVS